MNRTLALQAVNLLNEAMGLDPVAIEALIEQRVPCNQALGDHPTIQCLSEQPDECLLGMLGILNGICGVDEKGWGPIAAVYDDDTKRLLRFDLRG